MKPVSQPNLDSFGTSLRAIFNLDGDVVEGNDKFKYFFADNVYSIEDLLKKKNTDVQWNEVIDQANEDIFTMQLVDDLNGQRRVLKTNITKLPGSNLYVFEAIDLSEETEAIDALKQIITTNNAGSTEEYFKLLVLELDKLLSNIEYVIIGKLNDDQVSMNTIAVSRQGALLENNAFPIEGIISKTTVENGRQIYSSQLRNIFPESLFFEQIKAEGLIALPIRKTNGEVIGCVLGVSCTELQKPIYTSNVMEAFSVKAGVEFDRIKQNTVIESVKRRLDQKVSKMEIQHLLMSELSSYSEIGNGDLWGFSERLTKLVSNRLNISVVSVWMVSEDTVKGRNSCIYDKDFDTYVSSDKKIKDIFEKEFDNFIKLPYLDSNELTDVSFLSPYVSRYLESKKIRSMLDCPIRSGDKVLGVLSFENKLESDPWMSEEKYLIVQLSNLLSLTITNYQKAIAYQKLEESKNLFNKVQSIARFGTFTIEVKSKRAVFSKALCELLKIEHPRDYYLADKLENLPMIESIHENEKMDIINSIDQCLKQGEGFNKEFTAIFSEGDFHLLGCEGIPVTVNGEIVKIVGFVQDVTDIVKARDDALSKQKRIDNIVDQSPIGIIEWSLNFEVRNWNVASEKIFGWSKQEMIGNTAECLIPDSGKEDISLVWEQLINGGGGEYSLNKNNTKDNKLIHCEWRNTPLLDSNKQIVGVLSFVEDVTERITNEDEIIKSEKKFSTIFNTSPDAISISDLTTGEIIEINAGYSKISGWPHDEAIGKTTEELNIWISKEERRQFIELVTEKREVDGLEMRFRRKDGAKVIGLLSGRIVSLNNKPHLLAYFHDISDRKTSEDDLKKVNERYSSLAEDLEKRVKSRTKELSQMVDRLKKREADFGLLSRMQDLLLSCQSREETFEILRSTAVKLFPKANGGLALYEEKEKLFITVLKFGASNALSKEFAVDDCWGLRQGRMHEMLPGSHGPQCAHFTKKHVGTHYMCLPLMVQGRNFGMLWLDSNDKKQGFSQTDKQQIISIADTIKLALSNLDLRSALHNQAVRDPLTGLYNRRYMHECLDKNQARSERTGKPYCIALIDIDHFKKLNDSKGHDAGDAVLVSLADMLRTTLMDEEIPFRYGGEEFLILIPQSNLDEASKRMNEIRSKWRAHRVAFNGRDLGCVTMSIGISGFPAHGNTSSLLISSADKALYHAKESGRDQVQVFFCRPNLFENGDQGL